MNELEMTLKLAEATRDEFKKLFPNSHTYLNKECLGEGHYLMVFLGDKESFSNGIEHNDPMRHHYSFSLGEKGLKITATGCALGSLKTEEKWMYCTHKKLTFRKKEGTHDKCIEGMKKHFKALREFVDNEKVNMLDSVKDTYSKF